MQLHAANSGETLITTACTPLMIMDRAGVHFAPHITLDKAVCLEHFHSWAERQALEMRFEGLQACTK